MDNLIFANGRAITSKCSYNMSGRSCWVLVLEIDFWPPALDGANLVLDIRASVIGTRGSNPLWWCLLIQLSENAITLLSLLLISA